MKWYECVNNYCWIRLLHLKFQKYLRRKHMFLRFGADYAPWSSTGWRGHAILNECQSMGICIRIDINSMTIGCQSGYESIGIWVNVNDPSLWFHDQSLSDCPVGGKPTPLKNIWVCQLGLLFPTAWKNITCSNPPTNF